MSTSNPPGSERRRYVRMDTVFPVEMVLRRASKQEASAPLQGFTRNVSLGGLFLEFRSLPAAEAMILESREASLELLIHVPFLPKPYSISSSAAWLSKKEEDGRSIYQIGAQYDEAGSWIAKRIMRYAKVRRLIPRVFSATILLLLAVVAGLIFTQLHLAQENRRLVSSIVESAQNRDAMVRDLEMMASRQRKLAADLSAVKNQQSRSSEAIAAEGLSPDQLNFLNQELAASLRRESDLKNELALVNQQRAQKHEALSATSDAAGQTQEEILGQLVSWLERHANAQSGLVPSYEGDPKLDSKSYTYDQALSVIVFALFKKDEAAQKILSFYKDRAGKTDGGFVSSYDTPSGQPVEWNVHVGPNVWIGIAALQYQRMTGDTTYSGLAQAIGGWLLDLQAKDPEGGLRGGPKTEWFSTEHNLDAYAFFGMLHRTTGDPRYQAAQDRVFGWIMKHAADRQSGAFRRGKGDATIATDTFSWSIAAIGPARLAESDFDPEGVMEFAEEHCRVEVDFERPDRQKVRVTGFDFAKPQNQGRGGVVSTEWTAQAVVTFRVLENYFESAGNAEKAAYYRDKINFYLNELQKMIISSLSRVGQGHGCLPYASAENTETGHGWRTPAGHRTGSVAGTAYGVFAWLGFNPFDDSVER
ncbi:MAG: PilZ domain-containing protein [Candidatus Omnitrophica bacterium]|nr:PilZ domain-containing protein [Candidatus Omnitrophota bacterium]